MVCLGFNPPAAGWSAQTKPRSYGSRPRQTLLGVGSLIIFLSFILLDICSFQKTVELVFKLANPGLFLFIFILFKHQILQKNCCIQTRNVFNTIDRNRLQ